MRTKINFIKPIFITLIAIVFSTPALAGIEVFQNGKSVYKNTMAKNITCYYPDDRGTLNGSNSGNFMACSWKRSSTSSHGEVIFSKEAVVVKDGDIKKGDKHQA